MNPALTKRSTIWDDPGSVLNDPSYGVYSEIHLEVPDRVVNQMSVHLWFETLKEEHLGAG